MSLTQSLNLSQSQKLILSQRMLQSLKIMQMPLIELRNHIESVLESNPALEIDENVSFTQNDDIDLIDDSFNDSFDDDFVAADYKKSNVKEQDNVYQSGEISNVLEEVISSKETLADILICQLDIADLTDQEREIGLTIISLINSDGFFVDDIEEVFGVDNKTVALKVLNTIRDFDPPGIASSDIKEALLYQLEYSIANELTFKALDLLKNHFDFMLERKDKKIAKEMNISVDEVKELIDYIGKYNPYPGRPFSSGEIQYIIPDVIIYRLDGEFVLKINENIIPQLVISDYMKKMYKETRGKGKKTEIKYIKEKINDGKQLIKMIRGRKNSLLRLVTMLVAYQKEYFEKGVEYLKPLTMKDIADKIELSESTVSRLASSKFIQTEWGIKPIKYFFPSGIKSNNSNDTKSAVTIQEMIKEIISNESSNSISDQKISEILENQGVKIARRTVAKYRTKMKILSSQERTL